MPTIEFVAINGDEWETDPDNPVRTGTRVVVKYSVLNKGRTGVVVGLGRATKAHSHWMTFHEGNPEIPCPFGDWCDMLCDSEGPLVRYDDQDPRDESVDFYCGQGSSALEPL